VPRGDDTGPGELDTLLSSSAKEVDPAGSPEPAPLIAGRYQILSLAGAGSMGSVYRARDTELGEDVALKFLRSELVQAPDMLDRFRREVRLARRIAHRNVARVYDIGEHGRDRYLTMAFIDGEPLRAILQRSRPLPTGRVLAIACEVCDGLAAAHAAGVIHRDLKPDNIMVARDGTIAITDFGIARAAQVAGESVTATVGTALGTPAYMSPEQVEGAAQIDERADLYAVGVMLFEMLTGELPFSGGSPITVAAARLDGPPPDPRGLRPSLDARLADLVLRCMARAPADRFASADELRAALSQLATASPRDTGGERALRPAPASALATVASDKTVAVLPFRNDSGVDDAYLADGLTEDLIDTLSAAQGLRVRPRSATLRFAGSERDARAIGRELDVQVIVDGSVRRRGDVLRISARLVSVAEGFQLWARRFDRPAGDALVVADEVADAVARALTVGPVAQSRQAPTDPAAIDFYLRGRAELRDFGEGAMRRAVQLLEEAHARAPDDPTLLAALARAHGRSFFFGAEPQAVDRALALATRAVTLAPDHGEALLALAQVFFARSDYTAAAEQIHAAIARAPLMAEAQELLGRLRLEVGPLDAGISAMERAIGLDPLLLTPRLELARAMGLRGDFATARHLVATAPAGDLSARGPLIARLLGWSGDVAGWSDLLPRRSELPGAANFVDEVIAMLLSGHLDRSIEAKFTALASAARSSRFRILMLQIGAEFASRLGDVDAAHERVVRALDEGLIDLIWLDHCPPLAPLRADPRFAALRARLESMSGPIREILDRP
jgi:serine/threonine-protein kinase